MTDHGKQIHAVVWEPRVAFHPISGKRQRTTVMRNYTDRIVSKDDAAKLDRHYKRRAKENAA